MSLSRLPPFLLLVGLVAAYLPARAQNEEQNFRQRVLKQVADLYGPRDAPPPALDESLNVFLRADPSLPSGTEAAAVADTPTSAESLLPTGDPAASADETLLRSLLTQLRISGTVELNQQLLIVINQTPTAEGSAFPIKIGDTTHFIRIERISPRRLTISLGRASLTLRF